MPKSSMAMRTPSARRACSRSRVASASRMAAVSVTSIVRARRRQPGGGERVAHVVDEAVLGELAGGDVDGHAAARRAPGAAPAGGVAARLAQHLPAHLEDERRVLDVRQEARRRQQPVLGVLPAHERLDGRPCGRRRAPRSAGSAGRAGRGRGRATSSSREAPALHGGLQQRASRSRGCARRRPPARRPARAPARTSRSVPSTSPVDVAAPALRVRWTCPSSVS